MLEDATIAYQDTTKHATNGFLLALISFADRIGCVDLLRQVEVPMKEVQHSVHTKLLTLLFSYTIGCRSSHAIEQQLRPDQLVAQALGLTAIPDHSSFSRFYDRIDPAALEDLRLVGQQLHDQYGLAHHLDGIVLVDMDSTGVTVTGEQFELACPGYFPQARGASGYQLSVASATNAGQDVLAHILDAGNVNTGSRAWDLLYAVGERLGFLDDRVFLRGDRMYGMGAFIAHLCDLEVGFLLKGRDSRTARRWVETADHPLDWIPVSDTSAVVDSGPQVLAACPHPVRTILIRTWVPRRREYHDTYLVTSLPWTECSEVDIYHFYNERVTVEKLIERCKNVWHITHRPTHDFWGLKCYFELRFLAYNLVNWYQHYVLQETDLDIAPNIFHLVRTVAPQAVVAEQQPDGTLVIYLANAPAAIQQLMVTTHAWLRRLDDLALSQLARQRRIRFSWTCLVDAVWQAGRRLGDLYQPLLCKT